MSTTGPDPSPDVPAGAARDWRGLVSGDRLAYPILLILGVTDAAGYSVIGPVLPALRQATGASLTTMALLAACFPLTMLGGFALAGRIAHGRHATAALLLGLGCLLTGSMTFVATSALPALFAARAVMGVGSGCLWIAITFRTLQYWPGQEYLCMSRVYAAYSAGALLGPGLASLGGVPAPFAAYALLLLGCVPLVLALPAPSAARTIGRDPTVLRTRRFWIAALAIMFAILATGTLDGVLPLHFASHLNQTRIGLAYTATALLIAVSSAVAGSTRPTVALILGGTGIVAGITLAGATRTVPAWLAALALVGLGAGAAQTGATGILLAAVPTDRIVTAMVTWSQIGILGYLLAPAIGGPLAARLGFAWLGLLPATAAITLLAVARGGRRPGR
jgi:MFS family permease